MMATALDRRNAYKIAQAAEIAKRKAGEVDVLEDVARSGLSGVGEGVAGIIGLPMDAIDMVTRGGDWLGRKAGVIEDTPEHRAWLDAQLKSVDDYLPSSEDALHTMNDYTKGFGYNSEGLFEYQPQTTAGKYARTMGELAPSFVTGPAGLARKGAMWLGSSLASEAAGQLAEGTGYEDWARLGASVATGGRPRFSRPGPRTPHPTNYWKDILHNAEAKVESVGERNPERFADALRGTKKPRVQVTKGELLDEVTDPAGKMTREGFAELARDPAKMQKFSASEQAAIRRGGGDSLAEKSARWVERHAERPPRRLSDLYKGGVEMFTKGAALGGVIGTSPVGTGLTVVAPWMATKVAKPIAGATANIISNRNVRNAEREIRNGMRPGANRDEAMQAIARALLQNQAIQVGQ